jgi:hypothetical protein
MASETTTPNIGLQIAAFNEASWQVPTNYNWNLLDLIFGGEVTVPALNVTTLIAGNAGSFILPPFTAEVPAGSVPGSVYTLSYPPSALIGFFVNGLIQRNGVGLDYSVNSNIITLNVPTNLGDKVYAVYFHS